jgi:CRP-like cAMP-binding protein
MSSISAVQDRERLERHAERRPLRGLDIADSEELRLAMAPVELRPRQVLFGQGDEASSLFVVRLGMLKVSRTTASGRERILALLGPGDLFGEMSLLDGWNRDATVTAVTTATVLELPQERFDHWLAENPAVTGRLLNLMGRRLRESNSVVADLVFADVPSRVARLLLQLAEQFGSTAADGTVIVDHRLTQDELAQCVGAARETVNKALASFASRGWIDVRVKTMTIRDLAGLRALVA